MRGKVHNSERTTSNGPQTYSALWDSAYRSQPLHASHAGWIHGPLILLKLRAFVCFFVVNVDIIDVNNAVVDVIFEGFEAEDFIVQPKVIDCISASNA